MEDQEWKFVCKWCNKKYPCGKSLGGHMRSHVIANSAESEEKVEPNMKKVSSFIGEKGEPRVVELGGHSGYGLRENPKKTFKAVDADFPLPQEKVCKQCGKGFQSLKALCGHMACHSEKDRGLKDDHSWTTENQKLVMDSHSDTETEEQRLRTRSKNKRYKRIIIKSSSLSLANGSSSVSEIDEQEQEEVAMCLMMLSRDSSNWVGVNSVVESSDNNSVVLETKSSSIEMRVGRKEALDFVYDRDETPQMTKKVESTMIQSSQLDTEIVEQENSDSGYFLGEGLKVESDASVDGFHRNGTLYESKRAKVSVGAGYEETLAEIRKGFNKIKGHKAELRKDKSKENGNDGSGIISKLAKYEMRKKSKDGSENLELLNESSRKVRHGSSDAEVSKIAHKRSKYECLNCNKTFNSYQALGGHRPCHKRTNVSFESRYGTGENSVEADIALDKSSRKLGESLSNRKASAKDLSCKADKKMKSRKNKAHECPFCHRIFKNGQALGGHKRSHFIGGAAEEHNSRTPIFKAEYPELLDLNLPAPLEDEDDGQFDSW